MKWLMSKTYELPSLSSVLLLSELSTERLGVMLVVCGVTFSGSLTPALNDLSLVGYFPDWGDAGLDWAC